MNNEIIWQEFLRIVREEVGSRVVETWFKAIVFRHWDHINKVVTLQAPNPFIQEWVTSHYTPLFEQHLGRLVNEQYISISFTQSDIPLTHKAEPFTMTPAQQTPDFKELPARQVSMGKAQGKPSISIQPASLVKSSSRPRTLVSQQYQFSSFVVGSHNSLAYAAAYAITEKPGTLYNPFFIYGGAGLGKTHLLHAIGNEIKSRNSSTRILYQSADRFVNEFINAIRFDKMYQFEARYKDVDILLMDDIQFLSKKEGTQEAFFHIFNTLYQMQKQIVFTSDSLPGDIAGLADRIRSRLESGLVTDISTPTLETKIAIIKKKAESYGENISDEIADYIASTILSNVRELEGALIRVCAFASLTQQPLTLELAQKVLQRTPESRPVLLDLQAIGTKVAHHFNYTLQEMRSPKRNKDLTTARHVAMYLMKQYTNHSLREIGNFLERKDHSTISHALEKVEELKKTDDQVRKTIMNLERLISK